MAYKKILLLSLMALLIFWSYNLVILMMHRSEEVKVVDPKLKWALETVPAVPQNVMDPVAQGPKKSKEFQHEAPQFDDALDELSKVLPAWMIEGGMNFKDSREIFGRTVLRIRSRYQWDLETSMEVEITDIGVGADDSVVQALGFDLSVDEEQSETGYKVVQDEEGILMNHEYDFTDQAGSLQLLIGDRYLVEIQIQNLPEEAFQEILDRDIAIDELFKE